MVDAPPNFLPPYWDASAPRPRFTMGKRVRVRPGAPIGHVRTPAYVRGRSGVIERICGHFHDPQELAYGRQNGPKLPLYRVRFALVDLWPNDSGLNADAGFGASDTIDIEIYEPWLEPFFDYSRDVGEEAARLEGLMREGDG